MVTKHTHDTLRQAEMCPFCHHLVSPTNILKNVREYVDKEITNELQWVTIECVSGILLNIRDILNGIDPDAWLEEHV